MMKGLGKAMKFCLNSSATSVCLQTGWLFSLTLVETWKRDKRETKSEWLLWSLGNQASCTWKEQGPHRDLKIEAQKMLLMGSPREKVLAWHTYMAYLDRWIYNWFSVLFALHWCENTELFLCEGKEGGSGKRRWVSPTSEWSMRHRLTSRRSCRS